MKPTRLKRTGFSERMLFASAVLHIGVGAYGIVEQLHEDTHSPHKTGGDDAYENGAPDAGENDIWSETYHNLQLMEQAGGNAGDGGGECKPVKVDEGAVAHYPAEGVKRREEYYEDYNAHGETSGHGPEMLQS